MNRINGHNGVLALIPTYLTAMIMLISIVMLTSNIAKADDKGIKVRIFLFSGRPDPEFILDNQELIGKLKAGLAEAKSAKGCTKKTVIPSILGYRGIQISNSEKRAGLPASFAVYNGMIEVTDKRKSFFIDQGGALEKMLIDEAVRKGVIDKVIVMRMRAPQ